MLENSETCQQHRQPLHYALQTSNETWALCCHDCIRQDIPLRQKIVAIQDVKNSLAKFLDLQQPDSSAVKLLCAQLQSSINSICSYAIELSLEGDVLADAQGMLAGGQENGDSNSALIGFINKKAEFDAITERHAKQLNKISETNNILAILLASVQTYSKACEKERQGDYGSALLNPEMTAKSTLSSIFVTNDQVRKVQYAPAQRFCHFRQGFRDDSTTLFRVYSLLSDATNRYEQSQKKVQASEELLSEQKREIEELKYLLNQEMTLIRSMTEEHVLKMDVAEKQVRQCSEKFERQLKEKTEEFTLFRRAVDEQLRSKNQEMAAMKKQQEKREAAIQQFSRNKEIYQLQVINTLKAKNVDLQKELIQARQQYEFQCTGLNSKILEKQKDLRQLSAKCSQLMARNNQTDYLSQELSTSAVKLQQVTKTADELRQINRCLSAKQGKLQHKIALLVAEQEQKRGEFQKRMRGVEEALARTQAENDTLKKQLERQASELKRQQDGGNLIQNSTIECSSQEMKTLEAANASLQVQLQKCQNNLNFAEQSASELQYILRNIKAPLFSNGAITSKSLRSMIIRDCLGIHKTTSTEWKIVGEEIAKMGSVIDLQMIECDSGDVFCASVTKGSNPYSGCLLKRITMSSCGLTDQGLKHLQSATKLQELILGGNTKITQEAFKRLLGTLKNCSIIWLPYLRDVNLNGFRFSSGRQLEVVAKSLPNLTALSIRECGLGSQDAELVVNGMKSLQRLDIGKNKIGLEGATRVVKLLVNLVWLNMSNNNIGNQQQGAPVNPRTSRVSVGMTEFCTALGINKKLEVLEIENNSIEATERELIISSLPKTKISF